MFLFLPAVLLKLKNEKGNSYNKNEGSIHMAFLHAFVFFRFTNQQVPNKVLDTILAHLVNLWSRFGAHAFLKGFKNRPVF